ncbi:MAG TPA: glycosyltransferase [Acidimicrobiales bacterium]|nr:glycosyltransferase [Acidimicrobiales bacterium]
MRVLVWHVHGSWTTSFVQGRHDYLVPVLPDRSPDGLGRARTWDWPASVVEVTPEEARRSDIDAVVIQRPHELDHLVADWTGRRPGTEIPAVYVEHNAPEGRVNDMRHPAADRPDITVAHVTYFNRLFWDTGRARTAVVEHGVVDPGHIYVGDMPRAVAAVNDPVRRARVTGTDLLQDLGHRLPVDLFGIATEELGGTDVNQSELHAAMARRRVYLHPFRWTSLGLTLIEAMHIGLPVVGLATTEAPEAVPSGAGVLSNRPDVLVEAAKTLLADPELAAAMGKQGRQAALARYGLDRFLADWDRLLEEVTG